MSPSFIKPNSDMRDSDAITEEFENDFNSGEKLQISFAEENIEIGDVKYDQFNKNKTMRSLSDKANNI